MRCNQSSSGGTWGSSQRRSQGLQSTVDPAGLPASWGCPVWLLGDGIKIDLVGLLLERLWPRFPVWALLDVFVVKAEICALVLALERRVLFFHGWKHVLR